MITRDIKDIIVVANTCGSYMLNLFNGIPVKEFNGDKTDISFFSLTRYLKKFKEVPDVRTKIMEDHNGTDNIQKKDKGQAHQLIGSFKGFLMK